MLQETSLCQNFNKSYLTTVPKLIVTLSQSVVITSLLVLRSGRSLSLQFTAVDRICSSRMFGIITSKLVQEMKTHASMCLAQDDPISNKAGCFPKSHMSLLSPVEGSLI